MPVIKPANPKTCKKAQEKKDAIDKVVSLAKKYPIIGVLNMETLPAGSLLRMKQKLREDVEIFMTRKSLMKLAVESIKLQNGEELIAEFKGSPALMFTKENPFKIYKTIKKSKSAAPAKAGQEAPKDIMIPKGPTPFGPGPIISEFAMLGVKAGVEDGKVAVKEDTTVVKEGEVINDKLASMLQKLGIEPMEIGLDLRCVYEDGIIYGRKVLDVDEEQFMNDLMSCASHGVNLAVEAGITTKDTIEMLLQKATREGHSLAMEANILAQGMQEDIIAKLQRIANKIMEDTK